MSSFNRVYLSVIKKPETVRMIDFIIKKLESAINEKFNLIKVIPPLYDEINSSYLLRHDSYGRNINFDLIEDNKVASLFETLSKWSQNAVLNYNIKPGEGIYFEEDLIWRDIISNSKMNHHKKYLCIELVFSIETEKEKKKKIEDITQTIYEIIYEIATNLEKKYKIKNIFPKNIQFIDTQLLENEFYNLSSTSQENEIAIEQHAYVLMNPSRQLFSGKTHSKRLFLYDENYYNEIHLLNKIEQVSMNVASIAYKYWGKNLKKALESTSQIQLMNENSYQEIIENSLIETIEIKLSIFKILQILLNKGHIAEVQVDVLSNEAFILNSKKMIEKL